MADEKIRLFFDENMPVEVADRLNQLGIDTVTARDCDLLGDSDQSQLEWATEHGRVLCSYDSRSAAANKTPALTQDNELVLLAQTVVFNK